jgi:hypothetical protein
MLNEGILINDTATMMKSEMIKQIRRLKSTTPDKWERSVFWAITGYDRDEIDLEVEDNVIAYRTWVRNFDRLIRELVDDNYVRSVDADDGRGGMMLVPTETDPAIDFPHLVYPTAH